MRTLVEKVADGLGSERGSSNLQLGQKVAIDCKKTIFQHFGSVFTSERLKLEGIKNKNEAEMRQKSMDSFSP
jgi:hypothetical protein